MKKEQINIDIEGKAATAIYAVNQALEGWLRALVGACINRRNIHRLFIYSTAIFMCFPVAAGAQDFKPLREAIETSAAPYPLNRCAGLYLSIMRWAGPDRLGLETYSQFETTYRLAIAAGAYISGKERMGGSTEHLVNITVKAAEDISAVYLDRFRKNYAITGEAIGQDELMKDDFTFCRQLMEAVDNSGF